MSDPEGTLTTAQHEIMEVIWSFGESGATVTDVWEHVGQKRDITRTTVLNQVDRLEKRGWLRRQKRDGAYRYCAVRNREQTARTLTKEFVDGFFGGSASQLVTSLLGAKKLSPAEIKQLRKVLDNSLRKNRKEA